MGIPVSNDEMGGEPEMGAEPEMGGGAENNDKPFDDTPFDAGVEADEDESPEKFIQQLSGKLGQSLRAYTEDMGNPDYDLEKFAINSVLSATNSGEMDNEDQSDIIKKVKSSSTNDGEDDLNIDDEGGDTNLGKDDSEGESDGGDLDLSDIDMEEDFQRTGDAVKKGFPDVNPELLSNTPSYIYIPTNANVKVFEKTRSETDKGEMITIEFLEGKNKGKWANIFSRDLKSNEVEESHNPNGNGRTVFQDLTLGVKDGGMEENKYLNLESTKKSHIFVSDKQNIKEMIRENLTQKLTEGEVQPITKPITKPVIKPTRRSKPFRPSRIEEMPNPQPKADVTPISYISNDGLKDINNEITITFDVGKVRFVAEFVNNGEVLDKPKAYDEEWSYIYETDVLSNGKKYTILVSFFGHPQSHLEFSSFGGEELPKIEEV